MTLLASTNILLKQKRFMDYEKQKKERLEGEIARARIIELVVNPVKGSFDAAHLQEIHRRIFQDLPYLFPGKIREQTNSWCKDRVLDNGNRHIVFYADRKTIDKNFNKTLIEFGKPQDLKELSKEVFSDRLAKLYSDLDYLHPFHEGNSRTLRTFTAQIAKEAGWELNWEIHTTKETGRDTLYIARDKEVTLRFFPNLDEKKAMETANKAEYEAYMLILKPYQTMPSLKKIIYESLQERDLPSITEKTAQTKTIIPENYKPTPTAIAGTQHLRNEGVSDRNVRATMFGIDETNKKARELGLSEFEVKIKNNQPKAHDIETKPTKKAPRR